jgi:hypothetical protein
LLMWSGQVMKDIFHVSQHYGATFCKPHPLRDSDFFTRVLMG